MVEVIIGSVAVVAMLLLVNNLRKMAAPSGERDELDGNPHWETVKVVRVDKRGKYLDFPVAEIEVEAGIRRETLAGLVPTSIGGMPRVGDELEAHIEFDSIDTLRAPGRDTTPADVIAASFATLGVEGSTDEWDQVHTTYDERELSVWLHEDGWLTIMFTPEIQIAEGIEIELRAPGSGPLAPMLSDKLGMSGEPSDDSAALARRLTSKTLARLARFAEASVSWIYVDCEVIEIEGGLLFPDPDVVAALVREALEMVRAIEGDLADDEGDLGDEPATEGDGAW